MNYLFLIGTLITGVFIGMVSIYCYSKCRSIKKGDSLKMSIDIDTSNAMRKLNEMEKKLNKIAEKLNVINPK